MREKEIAAFDENYRRAAAHTYAWPKEKQETKARYDAGRIG
jgi:hypothetical protein